MKQAMVLTDYHIHTEFSDDSTAPIEEMVRAEIEMGMTHICFTDHVEDCCHDDPVSYEVDEFSKVRGRYLETASELREKYKGVLDIRTGIELGGANHDIKCAEKILALGGLDFVIGSVHNLRRERDFLAIRYKSEKECREMVRKYLLENIEMAETGLCDVLGHLGFANKFMFDQGFDVKLTDFPDELKFLLERLVEKGIGIEVNTSGLRRKIRDSAPDLEVVKLYKELGGEIITVGSDAHREEHAGYGIDYGFEILRQAGFEYVTVFEERKPKFLKF